MDMFGIFNRPALGNADDAVDVHTPRPDDDEDASTQMEGIHHHHHHHDDDDDDAADDDDILGMTLHLSNIPHNTHTHTTPLFMQVPMTTMMALALPAPL